VHPFIELPLPFIVFEKDLSNWIEKALSIWE
jgi:arginine deiminase